MTIHDNNFAALDAHFKQWRQIAAEIGARVTPFIKHAEEVKAQQKHCQELVMSLSAPHFDLPDPALIRYIEEAEAFQETLRGLISPAFEQLHRSFSELPPRTQEALLVLGAYGWYWDLEMPLRGLWLLKKALSEGNVEEAEEALAEYFESRLQKIETSISERFPNRAHLIGAAFNAHRRQEYILSIPVLLAQADGICKEVVNQYLFIKQGRKPRTKIYVDQIATGTFRAALLSPLAEPLPISASEGERSPDFDALNRHTVLHGQALDYGSKTNSLKAISLVNYVAHVLEVEKENP